MKKPEPQKTPAWLRQIVSGFEAAENLIPEPAWLQGEFPNWVENIGREVVKSLIPTARLKAGTAWEPGEVGAILGQQLAYWHWLSDQFAGDLDSAGNISWDELRRVFGEDVEERAKAFGAELGEMAAAYLNAAKMAVMIAVDQEYVPMAAFFGALGRAIAKKPVRGGDMGRTNTLLYIVMLTSWRSVEKLGSVPALHRKLCACIFLGPHLVGDLKRVEKICERIGLSYREIALSKNSASGPDIAN